MGSSSDRCRERRGLVALAVVASFSGCGLGPDRPPTIAATDIARSLQTATGIAVRQVAPPSAVPGLPELATTLSGGTSGESLTVFVFFEADGTKRVLGSGRSPAGVNILTRSNVVVMYRVARGRRDRSRQIRQALAAVIDA